MEQSNRGLTNPDEDAVQPVSTSLRGDSFDIGSKNLPSKDLSIDTILQNPGQLIQMLDITPAQAENIKALVVGGGAGAATKFLSKYFGSAFSGAIGGFAAGWLVDKIFKKQ